MKKVLVLVIAVSLFPLLSIFAQVRQSGISAAFTVTSNPVGVVVIVDGGYAGVTPLRDFKIAAGVHTVVLKLRGFLSRLDTLEVKTGDPLTREYEMHPACSLSVTSDPPGSSVYVDNVFLGLSPLVLDELSPGHAILAVSHKFYFTKIDTLNLSAGVLTRATMVLSPRPATISIEAPGPDVEVFVNNRVVSRGSLHDTLITPGAFEITARKASVERNVTFSGFILPDATARYSVNFDLPSRDPFFSSLILPGLGQRVAGSPTLGWGIEIAFGCALALAVGGEIKGAVSYADYSTSHSSYLKAATKAEVVSSHNTAQGQYDNAISAYRLRDIGLWSALAVYVLSAADAYFFHNKEDIILQLRLEQSPASSGAYRINGLSPEIRVGVRL